MIRDYMVANAIVAVRGGFKLYAVQSEQTKILLHHFIYTYFYASYTFTTNITTQVLLEIPIRKNLLVITAVIRLAHRSYDCDPKFLYDFLFFDSFCLPPLIFHFGHVILNYPVYVHTKGSQSLIIPTSNL